MATTRQKREKRDERLSMKGRSETHDSGSFGGPISLPEDRQFFSVKKTGPYRLEILPYKLPDGFLSRDAKEHHFEPGNVYPELTFWNHRGVGIDSQRKVCLWKMFGKPCPICEYVSDLKREDGEDSEREKLIKSLIPKERQLWNVFDHGDAEAGVQIWDVSFHLFGKMLDERIKNAEEDDPYRYYADLKEGSTLVVGFKQKSLETNKFWETSSIDFKERRGALKSEWLDQVLVLDDLLVVESYDKLKAMFLQTEGDDDKDDRKEDEPKKERKKSRAKPKEEKILTAKEAGLEKGDEVECGALICEIIKISGDGTSLTLMDADDEIHKAVAVSEVTKLDDVKVTGTGTTQPQGVIDTAESEAKTSSDDGEGGSWADDEWPDGDD